jgi:hypothetical protein
MTRQVEHILEVDAVTPWMPSKILTVTPCRWCFEYVCCLWGPALLTKLSLHFAISLFGNLAINRDVPIVNTSASLSCVLLRQQGRASIWIFLRISNGGTFYTPCVFTNILAFLQDISCELWENWNSGFIFHCEYRISFFLIVVLPCILISMKFFLSNKCTIY